VTETPDAHVAVVLLVDPRGRLLLQLRDGAAPISPDTWSMVGGHVEPGEDAEKAARRELMEESALAPEGPLWLLTDGLQPSSRGSGVTHWSIYTASTTAGDADIVVGEGADITFVEPAAVGGLALSPSAARNVPAFLDSTAYRLIADRARTLAQVDATSADFHDIVAAAEAVATDDEHDPEGSTIAFERSRVAALTAQGRRHLAELDRALAALVAGRYGVCERCGRAVGADRLAARPSATTCIACASRTG
jgi:RNA polymerase-binding transcription factor DksA/predicted NUDIX family NTP pyrophosphohydrolase